MVQSFEWDLKSRQRGPDFEWLKSQIVSKTMLALAVLCIPRVETDNSTGGKTGTSRRGYGYGTPKIARK